MRKETIEHKAYEARLRVRRPVELPCSRSRRNGPRVQRQPRTRRRRVVHSEERSTTPTIPSKVRADPPSGACSSTQGSIAIHPLVHDRAPESGSRSPVGSRSSTLTLMLMHPQVDPDHPSGRSRSDQRSTVTGPTVHAHAPSGRSSWTLRSTPSTHRCMPLHPRVDPLGPCGPRSCTRRCMPLHPRVDPLGPCGPRSCT
jgi:hypothetical protein